MDIKQILVTVGIMLFGSLLTFLATSYWSRRGAKTKAEEKAAEAEAQEKKAMHDRIAALEKQLSTVEQVVSPISQIMMDALRKQLTHADTPILDARLEDLSKPEGLSIAEKAELLALLEERSKDVAYSESERDAAHIMPAIMRRVASEKRAMNPDNYTLVNKPEAKSPVADKKQEEGSNEGGPKNASPVVTLQILDQEKK